MIFIYFLAIVIALTVTFVVLKCGTFFQKRIQFLHDPVYVPSLDEASQRMIILAKPTKKDLVADLGSGNGKLLLDFAPLSKHVDGYEIDPFLAFESRRKIHRIGYKNIDVKWESFWKPSFHEYDIILLYMTASIMKKLEEKLLRELKPGARVISQRFQFPHWKPEKKLGDCFLYIKK